MSQAPVILSWGEARGADFARFWWADAVASDDGVPFAIRPETNDAVPAGLGGEAVFSMVYLTVRAAASAVLQVTPILDDLDETTRAHPSGTLEILQPQITIPQQMGGPPTPMRTATFAVPLLARLIVGGVPTAIWHLRGERCRIRLASVGPIGTGALRLEQAELEYEVIRRAQFGEVTL